MTNEEYKKFSKTIEALYFKDCDKPIKRFTINGNRIEIFKDGTISINGVKLQYLTVENMNMAIAEVDKFNKGNGFLGEATFLHNKLFGKEEFFEKTLATIRNGLFFLPLGNGKFRFYTSKKELQDNDPKEFRFKAVMMYFDEHGKVKVDWN